MCTQFTPAFISDPRHPLHRLHCFAPEKTFSYYSNSDQILKPKLKSPPIIKWEILVEKILTGEIQVDPKIYRELLSKFNSKFASGKG